MFKALGTGAIGVKADLAEGARLAARYGFAGLYVSLDEIIALGVERAQRILTQAGVHVAGFSGWGVDPRASDAEFTAGLEVLRARCPQAREMGLTRTSMWIAPASDELDYAANYTFHQDRFGRIAAILADYDIRLGLEFVGPKTARDGRKHPFIHTMGEILQLGRDIGTGNVGLLLDAYHWYTSGGKVADIERLRDADIVDVHVNDAPTGVPRDKQMDLVRSLPGETGVIGVPTFLRALSQIGYSGPIMVEPFSKRLQNVTPDEAVRLTAEALGGVWRQAEL